MGVLYVTEPETLLGLKRERVQVRRDRAILAAPRLDDLALIGLCAPVHISPRAVRAVAKRRISLLLLTGRGEYVGRLSTRGAHRFDQRHTQAARVADPAFTLNLARLLVGGRLRNLRGFVLETPGESRTETQARALLALRMLAERVDAAQTLDAVRTVLPAAESAFFAIFGELLRAEGVVFHARTSGAAADPANLLLDLTSALLLRQLEDLLEDVGLDPDRGFVHAGGPGTLALAHDLALELSPVIVLPLVVSVLNRRTIRPSDCRFDTPDGLADDAAPSPRGALDREAARRFLVAYERLLAVPTWYAPQSRRLTLRQIVQEQIYALARHLRGEADYVPFAPPF